MLKETVGELQRKGYRFVAVGELLKLGEPQRTRDGYFNKPGDNLSLDTHFGIDGTGRWKLALTGMRGRQARRFLYNGAPVTCYSGQL